MHEVKLTPYNDCANRPAEIKYLYTIFTKVLMQHKNNIIFPWLL